jgi:hypothetical protein
LLPKIYAQCFVINLEKEGRIILLENYLLLIQWVVKKKKNFGNCVAGIEKKCIFAAAKTMNVF